MELLYQEFDTVSSGLDLKISRRHFFSIYFLHSFEFTLTINSLHFLSKTLLHQAVLLQLCPPLQFISEKYHGSGQQRLEYCGLTVNHSVYLSADCDNDNPTVYGLFLLGQMLIAIGALPLYTMGVAFLDEIASPKVVHFYLGVFYVSSAIGPALGFILGSVFLSLYVDPDEDSPPDALDPSFVGRWWAGYLLCGVTGIVVGLPLLAFPRVLPGTEWIIQEKRKEQHGTGACAKTAKRAESVNSETTTDGPESFSQKVHRLVRESKTMLRLSASMMLSGVVIFNSLGAASESFAVSRITARMKEK